MEYLLIGLVLGYLLGGGAIQWPRKKEKAEVDLRAEDRKRREQEHFQGLMTYDTKQAYGVRR